MLLVRLNLLRSIPTPTLWYVASRPALGATEQYQAENEESILSLRRENGKGGEKEGNQRIVLFAGASKPWSRGGEARCCDEERERGQRRGWLAWENRLGTDACQRAAAGLAGSITAPDLLSVGAVAPSLSSLHSRRVSSTALSRPRFSRSCKHYLCMYSFWGPFRFARREKGGFPPDPLDTAALLGRTQHQTAWVFCPAASTCNGGLLTGG